MGEGKIIAPSPKIYHHNGRKDIEGWIAKANQKYKTVMKPLAYSNTKEILKAEISGTFPGSLVVLNYNFKIVDERIQSLKITS